MDSIRVKGGNQLNGRIPISGAKNAALPLMIADYQPLFSFSGDRSWLHGQTANARVAAAPFKLSTQVSPGEGPATEETVPYMPVGKGMLARI